MKAEIHARTHPGHRPANEDALLVDGTILTGRARRTYGSVVQPDGILFAVADGVSGAPCATLASRRVLDELVSEQAKQGGLRPPLLRAVQTRLANGALNSPCFGMAACVAALHVTPSRISMLHAGDCRIYRGRNGVLEALTTDHSVGAGMIRRGDASALPEDNYASVYRGVESAVIADAAEADFEIGWNETTLAAGDLWLLTTDGMHGAFPALGEAGLLAPLLTSQTTRQRIDAIRRLHTMSFEVTSDNSSIIAIYTFD